MTEPSQDILFEILPSEPRRIFGCMVQGLLGVLLIYITIARPPTNFGWTVFLVVVGVAAIATAVRGWRASGGAIVLKTTGLYDHTGAAIAPLENIDKVDTALFTFKPSNGFLVRLKEPASRAWQPGMWWRIGRRVGVGGVTAGASTKIVADTLAMMVADRDKDADSLGHE